MMGSLGSVVIFGGAGFVGSNIARVFADHGARVTVVDGLLKRTGGRLANLDPIKGHVTIKQTRIEDTTGLNTLIRENDWVIDAMAWTSHRASIEDPLYDLRLNAESHLHLIAALNGMTNVRVVVLGSRGQYGKAGAPEISEETAMIPQDVQGIHKVAAESYFRVYANLRELRVASIRFPNCFGPNQLTEGDDIGLVGSFIRDALAGRPIEVFGRNRKRSIIYVHDVAEVVYRIAVTQLRGFQAYNLGGTIIGIDDLAKMIVRLAGRGSVQCRELPREIGAIDIGDAPMNVAKLKGVLGEIPNSDLEQSLKNTIEYFTRPLS